MQRNDLTITITKTNLMNNANEEVMSALLHESNLAWLEALVAKCTSANPDKIILALENHQKITSLHPAEYDMLIAIKNYLIDHFNRGATFIIIPELIQHELQDHTSSGATATPTAATPINTADVTNMLQQVATTTSISIATLATPNITADSDSLHDANIHSCRAPSADAELLEHIKTLLQLPIFTKKKRGAFFSSSNLPDGIEQMLALENPTLDDYAKIASKKFFQSALTTLARTETVDRFYGLLTNIALNKNITIKKDILEMYVRQELILNLEHEKTIQLMPGKITLSDKDKEILCGIIKLDPAKIPDLASGQLMLAAAAAALQTAPRP